MASRSEGPPPRRGSPRWIRGDPIFHGLVAVVAALLVALFAAIVYAFGRFSSGAIVRYGPGFLAGSRWDPVHAIFGAGPAIAGTLETGALALLFAVPVAIGAALFVSEYAPRRWRGPLATVIDLSAAVPSVVFAFWGILVVAPAMRSSVEPALSRAFGGVGPFAGAASGFDLLTTSLVLAMMIVPTITALARSALRAVPRAPREAALALGATRAESVRIAVLGPARPGIVGAILLGLGRALGEAIIVVSLIGNIYGYPSSLLGSGETIAGEILNDLNSAGPAERAALVELGLVLLLISFLVQVAARGLARRPLAPRLRARFGVGHRFPIPATDDRGGSPPAPALPARRPISRRLRGTAAVLLSGAATAVAIGPLASVLVTAIGKGGPAVVRPSFYTSELPPACLPNTGSACPLGGIGPAIQGTILLVGLAAIVAVPLGLLVGLYLAEYGRGRCSAAVRFVADVLVGFPSVLIGLFVVLVLLGTDPGLENTALAGSFALALLMLPIVARSSEDALRAVPAAQREAALALGFPRHRTALKAVLPPARGAVATGVFLAIARAGGETAAVVLTAFGSPFWFAGLDRPVAALAPVIFQQGVQSVYPNWQSDAWGAALVLLLLMLGASLAGRYASGPPHAPAEG